MKILLLVITLMFLAIRVGNTPRALSANEYRKNVKSYATNKVIMGNSGNDFIKYQATALCVAVAIMIFCVIYYGIIGGMCLSNYISIMSLLQIGLTLLNAKYLTGDTAVPRSIRVINVFVDYAYYPMVTLALVQLP